MNIIISTIFQGLLYSVLAIGVYITFRILNFADMTTEGSFTLGGSVCGIMILNGFNPVFSLLIAGISGCFAGLLTGFLNTKLKIQDILSGILVMIALYSINLRIMGKSNISILGKNTIFKFLGSSNTSDIIFGSIIAFLMLFIVCLFFKTQIGLAIRASGDNEKMAASLGINTNLSKIMALMISGFLCALSGALVVQNQGYADVNMGIGVIVIAFASIIIGETIIKKDSLLIKLFCIVLGSICYKFIIYLVLTMGMNPSDLKLFTAAIATTLLAVPNLREKFFTGKGGNKQCLN